MLSKPSLFEKESTTHGHWNLHRSILVAFTIGRREALHLDSILSSSCRLFLVVWCAYFREVSIHFLHVS